MAVNTSWSNRLIADLQRDFDLPLGAAQGLAGAFAMESGGFYAMQEAKPLVPGSRGGYGMAQWTGTRRKAFESHAKSLGLGVETYEAQYSYLREELKGKGRHDGGLISRLKGVDDPQTAQQITTKRFLRPSPNHVNTAARADWTNLVVGGYTKLPPGEIPSVATQLDVVDLANLSEKVSPTPRGRTQAQVARTRAALKAMPPTPRPRDERPTKESPVPGTPTQANIARTRMSAKQPQLRLPDIAGAIPVGRKPSVSEALVAQRKEQLLNRASQELEVPTPQSNGRKSTGIQNQRAEQQLLRPPNSPKTPASNGLANRNIADQRAEQQGNRPKQRMMLPAIEPAKPPSRIAPTPASSLQKNAARANGIMQSQAPKKEAPTPADVTQQRLARANAAAQSQIVLNELLDDGIAVVNAQSKKAPTPRGSDVKERAREKALELASNVSTVSNQSKREAAASGILSVIGDNLGITLGGSSQKGAQGGNGNNTSSSSGASVYRPSSGYGSSGYSTITSPGGTHTYDRDSGSWVAK